MSVFLLHCTHSWLKAKGLVRTRLLVSSRAAEPAGVSSPSAKSPKSDLSQTLAVFGVDGRSEFLHNPEIRKIYADGVGKFFGNYQSIQKFMDERIGSRALKAIGGGVPSEDVKDLNIQQLSEKLHGDMTEAGRHFCKSFCIVQSVIRGHYWDKMRTLFEIQEAVGGARLTLQEISAVLPVNELAKASMGMQKGVNGLLSRADFFLGNVNRSMCVGGRAEALNRTLVLEAEELRKEEESLWNTSSEVSAAKGEFQNALALEHAWNEASASKQSTVEFWEGQRTEAMSRLKSYTKQEHDYNYRCYGPFQYMWENDVALARTNVERTTAEIARFEQQIENDKAKHEEQSKAVATSNVIRARVEAEELLKQLHAQKDMREKNLNKRKEKVAKLTAQLSHILAKENKTDIDHLLDAQDALQKLANSGQQGSSKNDVFTSGWLKDLNFLATILSKMARETKTLQDQRKMLDIVIKWADDDTNVFVK